MTPAVKGICALLGVIVILLVVIGLMIDGAIPSFTKTVSTSGETPATGTAPAPQAVISAPPTSTGGPSGILLGGPTASGPNVAWHKYNQCAEGKMCVLYPNQEFGECRDGTPPTFRR